jgi:hypothetical protein
MIVSGPVPANGPLANAGLWQRDQETRDEALFNGKPALEELTGDNRLHGKAD